MIGGHESVKKMLIDKGADIFCVDAGHLACSAVDKNSIELLKELKELGVDVTKPEMSGITALHKAVSDRNVEMVKFLLDLGAKVDMQDDHGWTPRALAENQGHDEIKNIFQNIKENKQTAPVSPIPEDGTPNVSSFQSAPVMPDARGSLDNMLQPPNQEELPWLDSHRRQRANTFHNSIFGMISAANYGK